MYLKMNRKNHRKICAATLVFALACSLTAGVMSVPDVNAAKSAEQIEAERKRDEARDALDDTKKDIENLKVDEIDVKNDLKTAAAKLDSLVSKQEKLKTDIKSKQAEIEQADQELTEAKRVEKEQYEAMKLRIQYMYENSTDNSAWTAIIESRGISDMINRIEYASDINRSDRELMDAYEAAVQKVEDWTVQLAEQMDKLLGMKEDYESQQKDLDTLILALEQKRSDYADQLASAQKQAEDYRNTISEQEAIIRAEEAKAAQQNPDTYEGGGSGASGGLGDDSYLQDPDCNPANTTEVSGEAVVSYALQFVGNPYVWGGNSLTNGCDCSGFVHLVYQHFGIATPRYSQSFKTVGKPVAYQNMRAGDVVVYPGHVAIYIGNGCIVEAQSTRAGITSYRPVNCHTITAIRRLV